MKLEEIKKRLQELRNDIASIEQYNYTHFKDFVVNEPLKAEILNTIDELIFKLS